MGKADRSTDTTRDLKEEVDTPESSKEESRGQEETPRWDSSSPSHPSKNNKNPISTTTSRPTDTKKLKKDNPRKKFSTYKEKRFWIFLSAFLLIYYFFKIQAHDTMIQSSRNRRLQFEIYQNRVNEGFEEINKNLENRVLQLENQILLLQSDNQPIEESKVQQNSKKSKNPKKGKNDQKIKKTNLEVFLELAKLPIKLKKVLLGGTGGSAFNKEKDRIKASKHAQHRPIITEEGEIYLGDWKEHKHHGFGMLYSPKDQSYYEGYFEDGEFSGAGFMVFGDGEHRSGHWIDGVLWYDADPSHTWPGRNSEGLSKRKGKWGQEIGWLA